MKQSLSFEPNYKVGFNGIPPLSWERDMLCIGRVRGFSPNLGGNTDLIRPKCKFAVCTWDFLFVVDKFGRKRHRELYGRVWRI